MPPSAQVSVELRSLQTETYCYDHADRLTSTSDPAFHAIAYDDRGNTTTLGDQQLSYDGADRHLETTDGLDTVTYSRDATDRIVARSSTVVSDVEFRGAASADNGALGGSSLTIPRPSGVEGGDLMLLHVAVDGSLSMLTPPSGFTLVRETTSGGLRGAVYRKLAGATEPADYTVALSVPAQASGGIGAWSGVDPAAPIEASSQATADGVAVTVPSIAASERGRLVGLFAHKGAEVDPPSGMTERWEAATPNAVASLRATSQAADEPVTSTDLTGARTASSPNAGPWVGVLTTLRPKTFTTDTRYGFTTGGDSPSLTLDTQGQVIERTLSLPGGALLTKRSESDVWSYPNIHGDVVGTAEASGTKQGPTLHYDSYGDALNATPNSSADSFGYGWLGRHQRAVETNVGTDVIQMGARAYVPGVGRFLEVDPVEGGSANQYEYVSGDSVNATDLDGRCRRIGSLGRGATMYQYLTGYACTPDGFTERMGYTPQGIRTAGGWRMMNPKGGCSDFGQGGTWWSYDFRRACKVHDYGYDLLRYLSRSGSHRKAADRLFGYDMHAHCDTRAWYQRRNCHKWATYYHAFVVAWSAAEGWGTPCPCGTKIDG